MVHILIVEDSIADVQIYKNSISTSQNVNIICVSTGEEALKILDETKIDIFFLDVDLPGIDGFSLARKIRAMPDYALSYIVFITGYSQNQLEVFKELHCYDYIVKPFPLDEFSSKLMTLIDLVIKKEGQQEKTAEKSRMVLFTTEQGEFLINPDEIYYAEIKRNNCYLYTENQIFRIIGISLKEVIDTVNDEYFLRCHKSFAVNVKKIFGIIELNYRLWQITFRDKKETIDLSSKYYQDVFQKYKQLAKKEG
jgi:DNA-binding LytR/AlgR family response regulator